MTERAPRDTGVHPLLPQALAHHQAGRLDKAAEAYRTILRESPGHFDATHLLGVVAMQEGRLEEAQAGIAAALELKPDDQSALSNLTAAYLRGGNFEKAATVGERASKLFPPSVDALINYGTALHQLGRFRDAILPLEVAERMNPRSLDICNLLGSCLMKIGDAPRAVMIFRRATHLAPTDSTSWSNLSAALHANHEFDLALECAEKAVQMGQDPSNGLAAQASALFELGKIEESIATYQKAVAHNPTVMTLCGLAHALLAGGSYDEAVPYLRRAAALDDSNAYVRVFLTVSVLKPIYRSIEEINSSRAAFNQAMSELEAWFDSTKVPYAYMQVGAMQPFFLAYHPFNNRDLLGRFGRISVNWMKTIPNAAPKQPSARREGKFRLGIVSSHVRNQSVWNAILKGWVHKLDKTKFDIYLYKLDLDKDEESFAAQQQVTLFDDTPRTLTERIDAIRSANLDALIFDEVGMVSTTLQLAAVRLAPLQGATWGHPETSGLPTLDFYLSGDALEPPDGQNNYTERLIRLPNLGVYVEPLAPEHETTDLAALGLPLHEPLLLCAGSPFKYTPLHDWVWIEIAKGLKANGAGRLVFFSDSKGTMNVRLIERLRASFSKAGLQFDSHVCVVPFQSRSSYFALMRAATLMLDTLDFSGFNTALQAVEAGLPYLSYEGSFMRGRLASCLFRVMDIPELVATSYQEFAYNAVRLVAEPEKLRVIRTSIASKRAALFHDTAPIRALEDFLTEEIARERRKGLI